MSDKVTFESNQNGKRIAFRKSAIDVIYEQDPGVPKKTSPIVALTTNRGAVYEVRSSFNNAMQKLDQLS